MPTNVKSATATPSSFTTSTKAASTGSVFMMPKPPPDEPWDNTPVFWDSNKSAGGNNSLSKLMADPVPKLPDIWANQTLERGVIVSPPVSGYKNKRFRCYFQYNPDQYQYGYTFDQSALGSTPPIFQNESPTARGLALNATLTLTLFFARIEELWIGTHSSVTKAGGITTGTNRGPYVYGTKWDTWALERLAGVYGQSRGGDPNSPPITLPMSVYLGGVKNTGAFSMTAYMTGLDVNPQQFDKNMVESITTVDITFVRILSSLANVTNYDVSTLNQQAAGITS